MLSDDRVGQEGTVTRINCREYTQELEKLQDHTVLRIGATETISAPVAPSDGGEGVLNRCVELARAHGLEETLADLEHPELTVFLVA